jgi:hypothetical protein
VIRRPATAATSAALAFFLTAAPASAHGLVGKQDLPIPKWLFGWAAAAVLVVSFVGLAVLWPRARLEGLRERRVLTLPAWVDPLCGLLGVAAFTGLVYAGLAGSQVVNDNILPTVVYVIFWVGIPFATLLFGDLWRAFNPWRAAGRAFGWVARRIAGDAIPDALPYPARLGRWPAALGILLFAGLELAFSDRDDPSTLAVLALSYAAVQLVGMSLYGVRAWSDRADAFSVYFGLFASLSPVRWSRRALHVRPPLSGAAAVPATAGTVALLCVMIGSTSFDGFTSSAQWNSIVQWLAPRYRNLGLNADHAIELVFFTGIVGMILAITGLYLLGCVGMRSVRGLREPALTLARRFAPTLIPIALAYLMAHYFGLLSYQGQAMRYLVSDPLGDGSNVFGTASATIDYGWISATGIWYVQVAALVVGHACGLALAHDRALVLFGDARVATRSQYWMLAVMVAFTSLALWLLSNAD